MFVMESTTEKKDNWMLQPKSTYNVGLGFGCMGGNKVG